MDGSFSGAFTDGGLPISVDVTSASPHESKLAEEECLLKTGERLNGTTSLLFWSNVLLPALAWGVFSSWVIYEFLISWSTFYITLLSCAVAVISIPVVYPRLEVLSLSLLAQFLPAVATCFLFLNGQQGLAFGIFFFAFAVLLLRVGLQQHRAFWQNLKNANKIEAVVNASARRHCVAEFRK
jgi:hypothetical protein